MHNASAGRLHKKSQLYTKYGTDLSTIEDPVIIYVEIGHSREPQSVAVHNWAFGSLNQILAWRRLPPTDQHFHQGAGK
jgi:hypothetical protein